MARSVVLQGGPRCAGCHLPPRWCICAGLQPVACPVAVDVLIHAREAHRPSSTGRMIHRLIPGSRQHLYRHDQPPPRETLCAPGKSLWILHPFGEPLPTDTPIENLQLLLLDGSWSETSGMLRTVHGWGRPVRLPMTGTSRYWLRAQQGDGQFSTFEALLFLLAALGLNREHAALRLQFELYVYAGLRARGRKDAAADYLASSPLREDMPAFLETLSTRRPRLT